jgi:hypothetical protein
MLIQLGIVSMGVLDTVDMLAEIAVFMLADMIGWLLIVCLFVRMGIGMCGDWYSFARERSFYARSDTRVK